MCSNILEANTINHRTDNGNQRGLCPGIRQLYSGNILVSTNGAQLSPLFSAAEPINDSGAGTIGPTAPLNAGQTIYYELMIQTYTGTTPTDLKVWDGTWKASGIFDTNLLTVAGRIAPGRLP